MSMKRRLQKLVNTKNVIKQQYLQYPNLDDLTVFVYLPNKRGTTKTFKSIETNPEKGLLLDKWYEYKLTTYNLNAIAVEDKVFNIYTCKVSIGDIYVVDCEDLNVFVILRGLGELQTFMTQGKLYVIEYYLQRNTTKKITENVFST